MTTSRLLGAAVGAVLALSAVLSGCSGDDSPSADPTSSDTTSGSSSAPTSESATESASASASPYLPVPPGVELTPPGSRLSVGDHAVVAYKPRQGQVAALDIRVTRLEETTIKKSFSAWQLKPDQKRSTPYFVHASVENVGDSDVGGRDVPLYVVNDDNILLEATPFASAFKPCPSAPLPAKFGPGDRENACLVYLAPDHGKLVAVSFRPEETFNPITWTGKVEPLEPAKPTKKGDEKGRQKTG